MTADPSTHPPTEAVGDVRRRVTVIKIGDDSKGIVHAELLAGPKSVSHGDLELTPYGYRELEAVLAEFEKLRSDLAAMTSDRDWLRGEFEKATAGEHYWNTECRKAERVVGAAVAWRANPSDPEVLALLVAVDEWQSTQPKETDHGQV